jgi:hypothetical protein
MEVGNRKLRWKLQRKKWLEALGKNHKNFSKNFYLQRVGEASYIDKLQQTRGIQVQNKVQIFHA